MITSNDYSSSSSSSTAGSSSSSGSNITINRGYNTESPSHTYTLAPSSTRSVSGSADITTNSTNSITSSDALAITDNEALASTHKIPPLPPMDAHVSGTSSGSTNRYETSTSNSYSNSRSRSRSINNSSSTGSNSSVHDDNTAVGKLPSVLQLYKPSLSPSRQLGTVVYTSAATDTVPAIIDQTIKILVVGMLIHTYTRLHIFDYVLDT